MNTANGYFIVFAMGVGMSIGHHETSFWLAVWHIIAWPGYAGYNTAISIFHYTK